ncbi:MAG: chloride channel protein, partial [Thermovibrio sp.]
MENLKRLFFFSIVAGLSTGLAVSFYVLLSKGFSYAFYLGNPLETVPKLPFWYVAFITTSSIFIVNLIILNNEKAKEYGVREIARALDENRITFSLGDLAQKIVASALSI